MILGRLFSWQRLLPRHFPAPPPPLHSLSTWGLCANSSWSLLSASPPPLLSCFFPPPPMPPNLLLHLRSCLSPR